MYTIDCVFYLVDLLILRLLMVYIVEIICRKKGDYIYVWCMYSKELFCSKILFLSCLEITHLESKGSPKQLILCVAERILFILEWTYLRPTATKGSIFRKEADTNIDTTFSGCKEGYISLDDCFSSPSFSALVSSRFLLLLVLSLVCATSKNRIV